ncbi:MAG: protein arginine kinase [Planctomycetota bacterium]|jgi:protein arginine kinase|nr:protein arginine kinase [Planctomycetota bacterium]
MKIDDCFKNDGEWLKGAGPNSDIAVSTRVRLARNLANRRFPTHPDHSDRREVLDEIKDAFDAIPAGSSFIWYELDGQLPMDRRLLMERHLISRELAEGSGPRAVAFDETESMSVMVNEEDHLRIQCLRSGLRLREAFDCVNQLDDDLSERLAFAFDPIYGYLTSCPTNVGTGLRVSVMLHLPALVMTQHIEKVFRAVYEMRMTVRGFYGEGTEAYGELYQISNQITCGRSEEDILADMEATIQSIIHYEGKARHELAEKGRNRLEDRIWRSWGTLTNARLMSSEEAMRHLSSLRLGHVMGMMDKFELRDLQRLFLLSQPAHLQRMEGKELDSDARDLARAEFLRNRLGPEAN